MMEPIIYRKPKIKFTTFFNSFLSYAIYRLREHAQKPICKKSTVFFGLSILSVKIRNRKFDVNVILPVIVR